jgi:hypothetical protein
VMLRREPGRLRLRRRLLALSAPVVVLLVVTAIKLMSLAVVGDSAVSNFARGDGAALRADASRLGVLNLVEPARAPFAAGAADVLDGRLADADAHFSQALARTPGPQSCEVRINVELVRETQGDVEAAAGRTAAAERYRSALGVVGDAPANCFEGNSDPLAERRRVRQDTADRLRAKLAFLQSVPPPQAAGPNPPPPPPPPPPVASAGQPDTAAPALGPAGAGLSDIAPDRLPSPGAEPPGSIGSILAEVPRWSGCANY